MLRSGGVGLFICTETRDKQKDRKVGMHVEKLTNRQSKEWPDKQMEKERLLKKQKPTFILNCPEEDNDKVQNGHYPISQ